MPLRYHGGNRTNIHYACQGLPRGIACDPPQHVELGLAIPSLADVSLATRAFAACVREITSDCVTPHETLRASWETVYPEL